MIQIKKALIYQHSVCQLLEEIYTQYHTLYPNELSRAGKDIKTNKQTKPHFCRISSNSFSVFVGHKICYISHGSLINVTSVLSVVHTSHGKHFAGTTEHIETLHAV